MENVKQKDYDYLRKMSFMAQIGWWEADFLTKRYELSDTVSQLLGLEENSIGFYEFGEMIREDYRANITVEFGSIPQLKKYNQVFPIITRKGEEVWIDSRMAGKEIIEGRALVVSGFIQRVNHPEWKDTDYLQLNNQVTLRTSISHSLSQIMQEDSIDSGIPAILNAILRLFRGDRAYVFEYADDFTTQSCTYEVVAEGVTPEIEILRNLPFDHNQWWTSQILSGKTILINSLDDLSEEDAAPREFLAMQDIKSLLVVPLLIDNQIKGYLGVDVTREQRTWSNDDYQWISILANLVSICLTLHHTKRVVEDDRTFLSNLFRYMPLAYIRFSQLCNDEGEIVNYRVSDVNDRYTQLVGRPLETLLGKIATDIAPGLFELVHKRVERLEETQHLRIDLSFERTGKHSRAIIYKPTDNEVMALFLDTTETIQAYKSLDSSEKRLRNIFSNIPAGIEFYDKDGSLTDLNEKALEMFDIKREDAIGVNLFNNPNIPVSVREQIRKENTVDFRMSYRMDIARQYCQLNAEGVLELFVKSRKIFDKDGNLEGYVFILIDRTEQENAMNKIQDFDNLFLMASKHAKLGYIKINYCTKEGNAIRQWYENMGEKESTPLSEIIGIYPQMHPDDRRKMIEFFDGAKDGTHKSLQIELRIRRPGTTGQWNWIRMFGLVTRYLPEENIIDIIGVNYDITELKDIEEKLIEARDKAEEADRLKSAFLANMSHEIRTPLNAIVGFSGLLVEAEELEQRREFLELVERNNDQLLQLISDILDLSKIEAGTFDCVMENVDINGMCEDLKRSLQMKVTPGVELSFSPALPVCHIVSDRNRLSQVLSNFVNNAIKFTSYGSIQMRYEVSRDSIRFSVTDTGIGISPEQQETIFDRFVKLNNFVAGTGLGLSICKSIVTQLGGVIGVDSTPGRGSTFWFSLPVNWAV